MDREEEAKRIKLQKITEEAEQKRLASEFEQMKNQRIFREIEERELEEAQALLQEAEKRSKKKGKKPVLEVEKITKQTLVDLARSEQLREKQEMEKKLQKLVKTMDYFERAKREEVNPLIEAAFQHHLAEEEALLALEQQKAFEERAVSHMRSEHDRLQAERIERISQIIRSRKLERDAKRKMIYFLRSEDDRQKR